MPTNDTPPINVQNLKGRLSNQPLKQSVSPDILKRNLNVRRKASKKPRSTYQKILDEKIRADLDNVRLLIDDELKQYPYFEFLGKESKKYIKCSMICEKVLGKMIEPGSALVGWCKAVECELSRHVLSRLKENLKWFSRLNPDTKLYDLVRFESKTMRIEDLLRTLKEEKHLIGFRPKLMSVRLQMLEELRDMRTEAVHYTGNSHGKKAMKIHYKVIREFISDPVDGLLVRIIPQQ